jgi:hypothetical protein
MLPMQIVGTSNLRLLSTPLSKALFLIAITQAYGFMASVTARKKLLFTTVDMSLESIDSQDNPFVKMYEEKNDSLFAHDESSQTQDYLVDLFNHYSKSKVASSKIEYYSNKKKENAESEKDVIVLSDLEKAAARMREALGRNDEEKELVHDIELKDSILVSGYVFSGAESKLYIASPEEDRENQVIYLLPNRLVSLFMIREGDYVSGWADENIDVILSLSSVNGHIVE